jgi:hypothetical protein
MRKPDSEIPLSALVRCEKCGRRTRVMVETCVWCTDNVDHVGRKINRLWRACIRQRDRARKAEAERNAYKAALEEASEILHGKRHEFPLYGCAVLGAREIIDQALGQHPSQTHDLENQPRWTNGGV